MTYRNNRIRFNSLYIFDAKEICTSIISGNWPKFKYHEFHQTPNLIFASKWENIYLFWVFYEGFKMCPKFEFDIPVTRCTSFGSITPILKLLLLIN